MDLVVFPFLTNDQMNLFRTLIEDYNFLMASSKNFKMMENGNHETLGIILKCSEDNQIQVMRLVINY